MFERPEALAARHLSPRGYVRIGPFLLCMGLFSSFLLGCRRQRPAVTGYCDDKVPCAADWVGYRWRASRRVR